MRTVVVYGSAFLLGCAVVAVPMLLSARAIHVDESARNEQTMAPGIQMFLGVVGAPIGGAAACVALALLRRARTL